MRLFHALTLVLVTGLVTIAPNIAAADGPLDPVTGVLSPVTASAEEALAPVTKPVGPVAAPVAEPVRKAAGLGAADVGESPEGAAEDPEAGPGTRTSTAAAAPGTEGPPSGEGAAVHADGGELGSVCLLLPGASGAPADADVVVLDQSLADRLRAEEPELAQLLGDCPASSTDGPGAAVDVDAGQLGSICLRIDPDGAAGPLLATITLVDRDLLAELEAAGVPVRELVAPCPSPGTGPAPGGSDDGSVASGRTDREAVVLAARVPSGDRLPYTGLPLAALLTTATALLGTGYVLLRRGRAPVRRLSGQRCDRPCTHVT